MDERLTGHVRAYKSDGRVVRGRYRLVVNLPRVPVLNDAGEQARDERGVRRWRYPKQSRTVAASGVKTAGAQLQRWITELEARRTRDPRRLTVAVLFERWQDGTKHELKPKTRSFYSYNVRLHIVPSLGNLIAEEVQPSDLTRLYAAMRARGLSETSCHHVHVTIHACYAWALREELLERNPCDRVKHAPRQQRRELVAWTDAEIVHALAVAVESRKGRKATPIRLIQVPLVLAGWSGLRATEVSGLRREDLDLKLGTVRVERDVCYVDGELCVGPPKSESGRRTVPLPVQSVEILKEHLRLQDELRLARRGHWNRERYVLCTAAGMPVDPDNISSYWARFVRSRRLPALTFHGLRHSFATNIFDQAPEHKESMLKIVQELLGHSDPAITARIYLHVTERASTAARAEQERRIGKALEAEALKVSRPTSAQVVSLAGYRDAK